ncbi:MAG: RNA polymerase sigma factor [Bacteroidetes bacterium]|nr:MAG: RNA polymerase sigma factor [Bacteroidota bacterium]
MRDSSVKVKTWIEGCLNGRRDCQEGLYKHFFGYSIHLCLRYSDSYEEAEEILNDGWMKVFTKLEQYDPELPFKSWLRRILINAAVDYHRKFKKHKSVQTDLEGVDAPFDAHILEQLSYEEVLEAVQQLPPAYRLVFNLYVMEGFKHHEIAEMLDISVGTSKSNLSRAKEKLQQYLQRFDQKINTNPA